MLNSIAIHAASGFTANVPLNGSSTVSMTFSIRSQNADMTGTVSVGQYNFMQLFLGVPVVDSVSTVGTVTIPPTITSNGYTYTVIAIDKNAFINCSHITGIDIPEGVSTIGAAAFHGCKSLNSILFPASLTDIGASSFGECSKLASVTFAANSQLSTIGLNAFDACKLITSINLPASLVNIDGAFSNCAGLESIEVPAGVTTIGGATFANCTNLKSVLLKGTVQSLGKMAFMNCTQLSSLNLPDQLTSIESYAFQNCANLTNLKVPSGMSSLGGCAFYGCTGLKRIVISSTVTSIGDSAFAYCSTPMKVIFDNCTPTISKTAFYGCSDNDTLYFPTKYYETIRYDSKLSTFNLFPYMYIYKGFNTYSMDANIDLSGIKRLDSDYGLQDASEFKAYICRNYDDVNHVISQDQITGIVPAKQGLILSATVNEKYLFPISKLSATADVSNNKLIGVVTDTKIGIDNPNYRDFILVDGTFYKSSEGILGAGKSFLRIYNTNVGAKSNQIYFGTVPTGIVNVETDHIIDTDHQGIYDLNGRKVSNAKSLVGLPAGIYIVNGHKYVIK